MLQRYEKMRSYQMFSPKKCVSQRNRLGRSVVLTVQYAYKLNKAHSSADSRVLEYGWLRTVVRSVPYWA